MVGYLAVYWKASLTSSATSYLDIPTLPNDLSTSFHVISSEKPLLQTQLPSQNRMTNSSSFRSSVNMLDEYFFFFTSKSSTSHHTITLVIPHLICLACLLASSASQFSFVSVHQQHRSHSRSASQHLTIRHNGPSFIALGHGSWSRHGCSSSRQASTWSWSENLFRVHELCQLTSAGNLGGILNPGVTSTSASFQVVQLAPNVFTSYRVITQEVVVCFSTQHEHGTAN